MKILERPSKILPKNSWVWNNEEDGIMGQHIPVMANEIWSYLKLSPGKVIVDCTLGEGGHSEGVLGKIAPGGRLIGIDQDDDALSIARLRLSRFESMTTLVHDNFKNIRDVLRTTGIDAMDGVIFDLGVSSIQLNTPERGFSFQSDGPLNMRMDKHAQITAFDLINNLSEEEIASIIYTYGEERFSRRIARRIVEERNRQTISTTGQLADIVLDAMPHQERYKRIHPATRTFMALRIAVNRELEALTEGLRAALDMLRPGGIACVISFHSLEDRIVKNEFRQRAKEGTLSLITKKPLVPTEQEMRDNPRSRSAKLRVAEKI